MIFKNNYIFLIINCIKFVITQTPLYLSETSLVTINVSSNSETFFAVPGKTEKVTYNTFNSSFIIDKIYDNVEKHPLVNPNLATYWQSLPSNKMEFIEIHFFNIFLIRTIKITFCNNNSPIYDMRPKLFQIMAKQNDLLNWSLWRKFVPFGQCFDRINYPVVNCKILENRTISSCGDNQVVFNPMEELNIQFFNNNTNINFFMAQIIRFEFISPAISDNQLSYYSVADISIDYQCACNGHAISCDGEDKGVCKCLNYTDGKNCEKCLPLYNNKPWSNYNNITNFTCEACNCNNRSDSCVYNKQIGMGQCISCKYGTTGNNCEMCLPGYYLNQAFNISIESTCIPCNCSLIGSIGFNAICNSTTGQCPCKTNVVGPKCDICKDGYYNLGQSLVEGCQSCNCNMDGTLTCDKTNGFCLCKNNTIGLMCDICKSGYYNLSSSNSEGCIKCDCDLAGSLNSACESKTGNCNCINNIGGRDCRQPNPGFYSPYLDILTIEAENALNISKSSLVEMYGGGKQNSNFTGRGFVNCTDPYVLNLNFQSIFTSMAYIVLRYKSTATWKSVTATITILDNFNITKTICDGIPNRSTSKIESTLLTNSLIMTEYVCLLNKISYNLKFEISGAQTFGAYILIDSIIIMPDIKQIPVYKIVTEDIKSLMDSCFSSEQSYNLSERVNQSCRKQDYTLMIGLNQGPYSCKCNEIGSWNSTCAAFSGQCFCKNNVLNLNCDQCDVYSYNFFNSNGCIECGCNLYGSTSLQCLENGTCLCKSNVIGNKCNSCLENYWGLFTGNGCNACQCNGLYSVNTSCIDNGQCYCKNGISGLSCTQCAIGFYGLTTNGCTFCECNEWGSRISTCEQVSGACNCKSNVNGFKCNTCKQGYFGLGPYTEEGCIECYCNGKSNNCSSSPGWHLNLLISLIATSIADWKGIDLEGNTITIIRGSYAAGGTHAWQIENKENNQNVKYYFLSPDIFSGDKSSSYGLNLNFTLAVNNYNIKDLINSTQHVIIRGLSVKKNITASLPTIPTDQISNYSIKLNEKFWLVNGVPATLKDMLQVLYDIKDILIYGNYYSTLNSITSLIKVVLETGEYNPLSNEILLTNIEKCNCPEPYTGNKCQYCLEGFTKSLNGDCVMCNCNNHAKPGTYCDRETGKCQCADYTTGVNCEKCMDGYYGDPLSKLKDSCMPCLCPENVNDPYSIFFSKTCIKKSNGFECINCTNTIGERCNICSPGFYGIPANKSINGGYCQSCNCEFGCDNVTGICDSCRDNTMGIGCSQCSPNTYSLNITIAKKCIVCECDTNGSVGCNNITGTCQCKDSVTGIKCDSCKQGFYNFSINGCISCQCKDDNNKCDNITGICVCSNGISGDKCDRCINNATWDLKNKCNKPCNCKQANTINSTSNCDSLNGQCQCIDGYNGENCSNCTTREIDQQSCFPCPACYFLINTQIAKINNYFLSYNTILNDRKTLFNDNSQKYYSTLFNSYSIINNSFNLISNLKDNIAESKKIPIIPMQLEFSIITDSINSKKSIISNVFYLSNTLKDYSGNFSVNTTVTSDAFLINTTFNNVTKNQSDMYDLTLLAHRNIQYLVNLIKVFNITLDNFNLLTSTAKNNLIEIEASINQNLKISVDIKSIINKLFQNNIQTLNLNDSTVILSGDLEYTNYYLIMSKNMTQYSDDTLKTINENYVNYGVLLQNNGNQIIRSNKVLDDANKLLLIINAYCSVSYNSYINVTQNIDNLLINQQLITSIDLGNNLYTLNLINGLSNDLQLNQINQYIQIINALVLSQEYVSNVSNSALQANISSKTLQANFQQSLDESKLTQEKSSILESTYTRILNNEAVLEQKVNLISSKSSKIKDSILNINNKNTKSLNSGKITGELLDNLTQVTNPIKSNYENISINTNSLYSSSQQSNQTVKDAYLKEILNEDNYNQYSLKYNNIFNSFLTWQSAKNQVEKCIASLWVDITSINSPSTAKELLATSIDQSSQITTLVQQINELENQLFQLGSKLQLLNSDNTQCKI